MRTLLVTVATVAATLFGIPRSLWAQTAPVSPPVAEVVRLAEAGTSEDVIVAYVQNATTPFNLTADNVLYLKDLGVSSQVVTAMLNRDSALRAQAPAPIAVPPPVPAPPPEPVAPDVTPPDYASDAPEDVNYFYDNLSPYGSWVELDGVGWCWQPRVIAINREWRPYCDGGHWVDTDAGWCWQSDYSWGWAPFHYGRWYRHADCGWVWVPDRVWGPAWVLWRDGGETCGWAPLPPHAIFDVRLGWRFNGVSVGLNFDFGLRPEHFNFVAVRDFVGHDLGHHRLAPVEVTKIYNRTTIINNYRVDHNTIINGGVPVARVAAATHTQIQKVAIRDTPAGANVHATPGASVVYRPQLKAPTRQVHAVAQKVNPQHPVIQHATLTPSSRTGGSITVPSLRSTPTVPRTAPVQEGGRNNQPNQPGPRTSLPTTAPGSTTRLADTPRQSALPTTASTWTPTTPVRRIAPAPAQEPKQAARSPMTYKSDSGTPLYAVHAASASTPARAPSATLAQNTHTYYPKTAHQAAETHAAAQPSSRPAPAPSSRPAPEPSFHSTPAPASPPAPSTPGHQPGRS